MLSMIFRAVFGTKHERDVKRMRPVVDIGGVGALEGLDDIRHRGPSRDGTSLRFHILRTQDVAHGRVRLRQPEGHAAARELGAELRQHACSGEVHVR